MTNKEVKTKRKGLHKAFHVSKLDTYIAGSASILFIFLVLFKFLNRVFDLGISTAYISWKEALQIALLFGIYALLSDMYYQKYEAKYDA